MLGGGGARSGCRESAAWEASDEGQEIVDWQTARNTGGMGEGAEARTCFPSLVFKMNKTIKCKVIKLKARSCSRSVVPS